MSTPGSSSSGPYKYPAQSQDSRSYYHQSSATTSTASAYAYALQQQHQQSRQSHPYHSNSSAGTSTTHPYLAPQVQRQPSTQPRRAPPVLGDRAHSIEELAKLAALDSYDRYVDIKQDLRHAEVYLAQGNRDLEAEDLEWAFVNLARTATLVLNKMPTNTRYNEMRQAHRDTLTENGNYCLERMSEMKPKLVDRYEIWRKHYPNTKPDFDVARIRNAMAARDQEDLVIRAQASKEKRAASKEEAVRRAHDEERRRADIAPKRPELPRPGYDEEFRRKQEGARQAAEKKAYEDARQKQEDARRKDAEAKSRAAEGSGYASRRAKDEEAKRAEIERQKKEAEEVGRRREEEIMRRKRQEASRQEQDAATRRKAEELDHRQRLEESSRREQEGIANRQREVEAEAKANRSLLNPLSVSTSVSGPSTAQVPMSGTPSSAQPRMPSLVSSASPSSALSSSNGASSAPSSSAFSSSAPSSSSLSSTPSSVPSPTSNSMTSSQANTPRRLDALPILPLESPTREESDDSPSGWHHPQPQHAGTERAGRRTNSYALPITTTSPPPGGRPVAMQHPLLMTEHQRAQGYTPSLQSMFSPPMGGPPPGGLLFRPNNPEGPSMRNMPSSPDRPPAHIRHMWEQAGYGYHYAGSHPKPKPSRAPGDSRILRPEQVRDDAATVLGRELRIVKVPQDILARFLAVAAVNTARNRETCGLLMGKELGKEFKVTTLLIPKQHATSDTCAMEEEELVSEFSEKRKLTTLGWVHTHPTQSCFMSSLDLHTHAAFQCTLPEFFAIVCAPRHVPDCGIFRLTDPPGLKTILNCPDKAPFHPHPERPIYTDADKGHVVWIDDKTLEIVDLR